MALHLGYTPSHRWVQKGLPVLFDTMFDILMILFQVVQGLLIGYIVLGFLFAFNVINTSNHMLTSIHHALDSLLTPLLRPFRKILPSAGGMDFSPIALVVTMQIITTVLINYQRHYL